MIFHRWETVSHIISDTKLKWFERADFDEEDEMDFGDEGKIGIMQFKYGYNGVKSPRNFFELCDITSYY